MNPWVMLASAAGLLLTWFVPSPSSAQSDIADVQVDFFRGPVIANSRVVSLGGAYTGFAEGTAGIPFNPAAVAQRSYYSEDWFDYDYDWDILVPGAFSGDFDFFNSGNQSSDTFLAYAVGGHLQFGQFGIGAFIAGTNVEVATQEGDRFRAELLEGQLALGYALWGHRLVLGASFVAGLIQLAEEDNLFSFYRTPSFGGRFGAILRLRKLPVRIGATFQTALWTQDANPCTADSCPPDFVLPRAVAGPWFLTWGVAWTPWDERGILNPVPPFMVDPKPPSDPSYAPEEDRKARYRGGRYVMITTDLRITGPVDDGISFESLVQQDFVRSGTRVNVSPRLGVESEVVSRRLRLRAGTYWEPGRIEGRNGRLHGTVGLQVRMFDIKLPLWGWKGLSFLTSTDVARGYSNLSASILSFWN
jgi:hypothetical protein